VTEFALELEVVSAAGWVYDYNCDTRKEIDVLEDGTLQGFLVKLGAWPRRNFNGHLGIFQPLDSEPHPFWGSEFPQ
jgi:hypothetical protein